MRRLSLCCLALAMTYTTALGQQPAAESAAEMVYTKDSLGMVKSQIADKKAILLDVRSQREWDNAHLRLAKFIPTSVVRDADQCQAATRDLDRQLLIYVHCQKGGRAKICADVLEQMGFQAKPLILDYDDLVKAGFEEASGED